MMFIYYQMSKKTNMLKDIFDIEDSSIKTLLKMVSFKLTYTA